MTNGWDLVSGLFEDVVRYQAYCSVVILIGFLIATNYLQRKALDRATDVMLCCAPEIRTTRVFLDAKRYFDRRSPEAITKVAKSVGADMAKHNVNPANAGPAERDATLPDPESRWSGFVLHKLPPFVLIFITLVFSIISYFGAQYPAVANLPSFVLGGGAAIPVANEAATSINQASLRVYESGTLFMVSVTFLVSYVRTIARLVERINTSDIRPISYYFLALNMLTSVLVTIVSRHLLTFLGLTGVGNMEHGAMAAVAFLIGWNPGLWLDDMWQKISEKLKMGFLRPRPPNTVNLAQDMNLLMVQGLEGDCIDRLAELGVTNCQDLARRNAVVLWLRTPYTLELVCDWIAQSQLCLRYEDDRVRLLRQVGVRDICCFMECLRDEKCIDALVDVLNTAPPAGGTERPKMTAELLAREKAAIEVDPSYVQLTELHEAMTPRTAVVRNPPQAVQMPGDDPDAPVKNDAAP